MEKTKLNRFISKYFLNGSAESVVWHCKDDVLSVKFVDDTKSIIGDVSCEKSNFPESEFGVNQTSKLRSLLNVVGETIDIDVRLKDDAAVMLQISDSNVDVNYVLSDMSIIAKVPNLKTLPVWDLVLSVDEKFIDNFVKATNALSDVKEFAVVAKKDKVNFVIGHSNINTTKVAINIDVKTFNEMAVTYFSAAHLKEVLVASKDAKIGKIEVSSKGLMRITFNVDDFKATYFLVSKQDVNA